MLPQRQRIAGNGAVVVCLRGDNAVQRVCDGGAGMNVLPQRQLIAGNGAVVVCLRGENAVQRVCDGGAGVNVLPQRQRIAGNGAVVVCLRGDNAVQGFCDWGAGVNVLPQRQLIAGNAAVVAKWEGVKGEQMFGPALGLFQGRFGDFTPSEGVGRWRGFETTSEGERKMRESASPSEGGKGPLGGGTRLYGVLEAVLRLLTFGRCAENAGTCLTFGRWDETVPLW